MKGWRRYGARLAVFALLSVLVAGCAATNRSITLHYLPTSAAKGGSGEIWLAGAGGASRGVKSDAGRWVAGTVKDSDGNTLGKVRIRTAPTELLLDAFDRELTDAGFGVRRVDSLPAGVSKGVVLMVTVMELEEVSGVMKSEGTSRLAVSFEIWKNGAKIRKLEYESRISDFAVKDRNRLLPDIWLKSAQDLMKHAVPDVIMEMEG